MNKGIHLDLDTFKMSYELVGGPPKDQKFPEKFHWSYTQSYTDIPEFSVFFWTTQLASYV